VLPHIGYSYSREVPKSRTFLPPIRSCILFRRGSMHSLNVSAQEACCTAGTHSTSVTCVSDNLCLDFHLHRHPDLCSCPCSCLCPSPLPCLGCALCLHPVLCFCFCSCSSPSLYFCPFLCLYSCLCFGFCTLSEVRAGELYNSNTSCGRTARRRLYGGKIGNPRLFASLYGAPRPCFRPSYFLLYFVSLQQAAVE
jgi:hypothetical protein